MFLRALTPLSGGMLPLPQSVFTRSYVREKSLGPTLEFWTFLHGPLLLLRAHFLFESIEVSKLARELCEG